MIFGFRYLSPIDVMALLPGKVSLIDGENIDFLITREPVAEFVAKNLIVFSPLLDNKFNGEIQDENFNFNPAEFSAKIEGK